MFENEEGKCLCGKRVELHIGIPGEIGRVRCRSCLLRLSSFCTGISNLPTSNFFWRSSPEFHRHPLLSPIHRFFSLHCLSNLIPSTSTSNTRDGRCDRPVHPHPTPPRHSSPPRHLPPR